MSNSDMDLKSTILAYGLVKAAGLIPKESNVLLLLNDSVGQLVFLLNYSRFT